MNVDRINSTSTKYKCCHGHFSCNRHPLDNLSEKEDGFATQVPDWLPKVRKNRIMVRFTTWSFVLRLNICWGLRNGDTGEVTEGAEITGSRSSVVQTYIGKIDF